MCSPAAPEPTDPGNVPAYLEHWPGLFVRRGQAIVAASPEDQAVARRYPDFADKGAIRDGKRLTIMTRATHYAVGEEVRVIHAVDFVESGHRVFVMGPKPVHSEFVDDRLASDAAPADDDPLAPSTYAGRVVASPAVDFNYAITSYTFAEPGQHSIQWRLGSLRSNVLVLEVGR
jgi:hypothetical protein